MGISLGKTNYCLSQLADKGMVKIGRFQGSKNKLKYNMDFYDCISKTKMPYRVN